ncbi:PilT protein domain protein [Candidatus Desulfosporosinus infrequens]|uniref:PilT protein domain protein n=1 Tax=Candidatus Desulfosporosinus infrequens TaxID=2043169 RepID=A0A2U3L2Y2_9FIRM|nr:PilT protein domain protein [Candidatus Desulfosporosinus infrequens]
MGRLEDDIKRFSRIAIDTNAFIYLMERHPKYFTIVRELFNAVEIGKVYAVSSVLLITEILTKPLKDSNKGLADRYLAFISTFPNLGLREIDQNIALQAAKLRARYGFKTPDALFLATAMEEKAEAFITNDVRLQGIENIEIVLLNNFVE